MIKWSESFSVSHKGIDEQHKKLIGIIEEVTLIISKENHQLKDFVNVVGELDNYVEEHFRYEEVLMKKHSYPHMEEHVQEHNELRSKMSELNIFDVGKSKEFFDDMLVYLVNWLSKHIMQTDKKLGLFISKQ